MVIVATPASMRNFTYSNCSGLRCSGWVMNSSALTGSIISLAPGLSSPSWLEKTQKAAKPDASTGFCAKEDEWNARCANSSQGKGTGFMKDQLKLSQGKKGSPCYAVFSCASPGNGYSVSGPRVRVPGSARDKSQECVQATLWWMNGLLWLFECSNWLTRMASPL